MLKLNKKSKSKTNSMIKYHQNDGIIYNMNTNVNYTRNVRFKVEFDTVNKSDVFPIYKIYCLNRDAVFCIHGYIHIHHIQQSCW